MEQAMKHTGRARSMGIGLLMGGLTSLLVTIGGSMLSAALILKNDLPEEAVGYCSAGIIFFSTYLGAQLAAAQIKHRRLYVYSLSALIYFGCLLSMTALFFGGQYQGVAVTGLVVLAGWGVCVLTGRGGQKRRPAHKVKIKRR